METVNPPEVRTEWLTDDGRITNHPEFPVLIYSKSIRGMSRGDAMLVERTFSTNWWFYAWRSGVYDFHHYHSTAHEVLGVYDGEASIQLGGESGIKVVVLPGDVLNIPAGVGHRNLGSTDDFAVVGAYPRGQRWDLCYSEETGRIGIVDRLARVTYSETDPVYGEEGPLKTYWKMDC